MDELENFLISRNIDRLVGMLEIERNSADREAITARLVKEEDKLGRNLAQLSRIEKCICDTETRIATQSSRIASLRQDAEVRQLALELLATLEQTHEVLVERRAQIGTELDRCESSSPTGLQTIGDPNGIRTRVVTLKG